tara:strand:+ start:35824 stop:37989 length:2166 start_codon:yes stop_codon:yes gene_type:complete
MADKPVTQPIPLARPVQLQQAVIKSETFGKMSNVKLPKSKMSQAFDTLNRIIPEAAKLASSQLNARAQEDETRQTARALNGMEPTEDATKAGRTAHRMVDVRNKTNEMMVKINEDASSFVGSPDEWEEHVVERQNELFALTGTGEDALKVTGSIFREQLPKAQLVKYRADQIRDQKAKYLSTKTSFRGAVGTAFKPEEQAQNFGQVMREAKSLGMTQVAVQEALIDASVEQAAMGDLSLIDMTKAIGLYEESPALQTAFKKAATNIRKEEQAMIAVQKEGLNTELSNSPLMSFEDFATRANNQRDGADETIWTAEQIKSSYEKQSKRHDKKFNVDRTFLASLQTQPVGDGSVIDIDSFTGAEKQQMVDSYNALYHRNLLEAERDIQDPSTKSETVRQLLVEKGTWLQGMGLEDKTWTKDFKHLNDLPASAIREMPEELVPSLLATIGRGDDLESVPDVLSSHASTEEQALMLAYKDNNRLGMTPRQSLLLAKEQIAATPIPLTGDAYTKFYGKIKSTVDSSYSNWFDGKEDISDTEIANASSTIEKRAKVWYNVLKDEDKAISRATAEFQATNHQLSDGTLVNGNLNLLAAKMNVPNNHQTVDRILVTLPMKMSALSGQEGFEEYTTNTATPPEEWTKHITKDYMIIFKDEYGSEVAKPLALHEAAGFSIEQMVKQRNENISTLNLQRKKAQALQAKPTGSMLGNWLTTNAKKQVDEKVID